MNLGDGEQLMVGGVSTDHPGTPGPPVMPGGDPSVGPPMLYPCRRGHGVPHGWRGQHRKSSSACSRASPVSDSGVLGVGSRSRSSPHLSTWPSRLVSGPGGDRQAPP